MQYGILMLNNDYINIRKRQPSITKKQTGTNHVFLSPFQLYLSLFFLQAFYWNTDATFSHRSHDYKYKITKDKNYHFSPEKKKLTVFFETLFAAKPDALLMTSLKISAATMGFWLTVWAEQVATCTRNLVATFLWCVTQINRNRATSLE